LPNKLFNCCLHFFSIRYFLNLCHVPTLLFVIFSSYHLFKIYTLGWTLPLSTQIRRVLLSKKQPFKLYLETYRCQQTAEEVVLAQYFYFLPAMWSKPINQFIFAHLLGAISSIIIVFFLSFPLVRVSHFLKYSILSLSLLQNTHEQFYFLNQSFLSNRYLDIYFLTPFSFRHRLILHLCI